MLKFNIISAILLIISSTVTTAQTDQNLIANGDFSDGQDHWLTWISNEATAYGSVQNGEFVMAIDGGGSENYHVQLMQTDLLIEQGKTYTVSFDAYADGSRTISMFIQQNSDPWYVYYVLPDITLTTNKQHFSTSFKIDQANDPGSRIVFNMGLSDVDVNIDNVCLSIAPVPPVPFKRGLNLSGWFQNITSISELNFKQYTRQDLVNIQSLGCDHIRLPMELFDMTGPAPDYKLDPLFYMFIDQVIDWAEELGLYLILDNHSFDPDDEIQPDVIDQLLAVWAQLADHCKNRSDLIYYEILNEPHAISDEVWNEMQQQAIDTIRSYDQVHTIIVSPAYWGNYEHLQLMPDYNDSNLIYTFHFYDPFIFTTYQGANLAGVPYPYNAARMPDLPEELKGTWLEDFYIRYPDEGNDTWIQSQIDEIVQFRDDRQVPVWCGEFGVMIPYCEIEDRVRWLTVVRTCLENNNIAWTMWEYGRGMGIFENDREMFEYDVNIPIIEALGLTPPAQSEFQLVPDTAGLIIYDDYLPQRVFRTNWYPNDLVDYYSENSPKEGDYCISWSAADKYSSLGFRFSPIHDLTTLRISSYLLDLWMRSTHQNFKFDIRFVDTDNDDPSDHPWRMRFVVDNSVVEWDGTWQHIQLPLTDFTEQGAWDDPTWYDPQGLFDWSSVEYFEIASDYDDMNNIELFIDNIKIVEPEEVQTDTPDSGNPVQLPGTIEAENYPNPFNSSTIIRYSLPQPGHVTLEIFNMFGEKICKLFNSFQDSGSHIIEWNAGSNNSDKITSGIYFLSIEAVCDRQTFTSMEKMVLIK
jgi:endoglucanase